MSESPELRLLDAVRDSVADIFGGRAAVQSRLMPLTDADELADLHITPYLEGPAEYDIIGRAVVGESIVVSIAIQQRVAAATSNELGQTVLDGFDNLPFADTVFGFVREITDAFGPSGPLQDHDFEGWILRDLDRDRAFEPAHLILGVLTVIVSLTFGITYTDEE